MATSRSLYAAYKLVKYRTLKLEMEANRKPVYNGVLVTEDKLLVIDSLAWNLRLYNRHDGKLLSTSHTLEGRPVGVCLISKTEVAVCLFHSMVAILSFKSIDDVKLVKTLDLRTGFDFCHSVAKLNSRDKLVVSGRKLNDLMFYWCVVNLTDGRVDSTHKICEGGYRSHVAIKGNTVYISCRTDDATGNGVYAYDIFKPHTRKFLYQHHRLAPGSVLVDRRDFIYVCDSNSNSIHQLTDSGQLVSINRVSSRVHDIFYDVQHGVLYTTLGFGSNVMNVYKLEYLYQSKLTTEWNFTVKELSVAWHSVEVFLLEELYPKHLLTLFEKINFLSAKECEDIYKLRRRQVVKEILQRIKAKLPEAFSSFIHVLNETKQEVVVQGLRKQIERTRGPRTTTHDEEYNAVVSSIVYYKMNLELLKDGCIMNETESETRTYLDNGRILFYYNMKSHCLTVENGSIVVCLRPLNNLTKEGLLFFIQHDGIGDFISDVLKRKSIFRSLPDGEMSIHVQVYCYDKDSHSEGEDVQYRGYTQMELQESFTVTDNPQMIKKNLNLQYDNLVEEIDPLLFKHTFITRGILDKIFFKKLKSLKRRARAAHFLKTVTDKGSTALEALVDVLRNNELDDLANDLCTVRDSSSNIKDEGQVDDSLLKVVQEDSETHDHESKLWSGLFTATVKKNEDGDRKPEIMGSKEAIESVTPETSTQSEQTRDYVDEIASSVTDLTIHDECKEPLQRRDLPPGKKYHAFFSYSSSDIDWVKQTVERLEKDHGFVCCEYERDNTPGTPLLKFADDSIRNAYKTVVVMTKEAIQSGFVLHEIQMALNLGFNENRNCVVPVLLEDCEIPGYLSVLNYVDARDTKPQNIWWPKLVMELET